MIPHSSATADASPFFPSITTEVALPPPLILARWHQFAIMVNFLSQEEQKQDLLDATGLDVKQVNNWFINQRKRHWEGKASAPQSSKVATCHALMA